MFGVPCAKASHFTMCLLASDRQQYFTVLLGFHVLKYSSQAQRTRQQVAVPACGNSLIAVSGPHRDGLKSEWGVIVPTTPLEHQQLKTACDEGDSLVEGDNGNRISSRVKRLGGPRNRSSSLATAPWYSVLAGSNRSLD